MKRQMPSRIRALVLALLGILVEMVSGTATAEAQVSFGVNRVLLVAAIDSPTQSCQGLRDTLDSLTDPSVYNRYLIRLEPGDFDCGSQTLFVPRGVVLEGGGQWVTVISGDIQNPSLGVVHMLNGSLLRDLTIQNVASSATSEAIAVSIWELGSHPHVRIEDAYLQSLALDDSLQIAVMAVFATVRILGSRIRADVRVTNSSTINAHQTTLEAGVSSDLSSYRRCWSCDDGGDHLDKYCSDGS